MQKGKKDSFDKANEALMSKKNRVTSPTSAEDDDEITRPEASPKKSHVYIRAKPSVVWEHMKKVNNEKVACNHCTSMWIHLDGSTSMPLRHIKAEHYDKLTDEQKERMTKNGETSGKGGKMPKRTLFKKFVEEKTYLPLPRGSESVKRFDRKLAKALISSNAS